MYKSILFSMKGIQVCNDHRRSKRLKTSQTR